MFQLGSDVLMLTILMSCLIHLRISMNISAIACSENLLFWIVLKRIWYSVNYLSIMVQD